MDNQFDVASISPYNEEQVQEAIKRLLDYPQFLNNLANVIYQGNRSNTNRLSSYFKSSLPQELLKVKTYDDFQRIITCRFLLPTIEQHSIDHFTFSGVENLDKDKPYIYITNHRDIVLDCALLDYALFFGGSHNLCEMCFGDNLMLNQFSKDLFKLNGGITVYRSLPTHEKILATKALSEYMYYAHNQKKKSIWIAQKSSRSKDGIDDTSTAVLKMIYLEYKKQGLSFSEAIKRMNIVPVAISYQYDPCDISKSKEVISSLKTECVYKKSKYEDMLNLLRGLRKQKGNVHISIGTELTGTYESPADVAREIDRQIHLNYKLWDTNLFCYDFLNNSEEFEKEYLKFKERDFFKRYKGLNQEVVNAVLKSYANPVISMLKELDEANKQ